MAGEERGVDVQRRDRGRRQDLLVQELAIARDHEDVWLKSSERSSELAAARGLRLEDRNLALVCEQGDLSPLDRAPPPARAIWARHDSDEVMLRL